MNNKNILNIIEILKLTYPEATCSLDFTTPFELLVAVVLSAQCTDERVNKTTPSIFKECNTPTQFAEIPQEKLEELIHPCGFYKTKAKNLKLAAKMILEEFSGQVPNTMEELIKIPGVGRKTANVILLEAFNKPMRNCCRHSC